MAEAEKSVNKSAYKMLLIVIKIIPMLLALCAALNMFFDFFGIDSRLLSYIGGISFLPLLLLYLISIVFRYCRYHRMFLHYILVTNILAYLDYSVGLPIADKSLFMLHLIVLCIFLFLVLYYYRKEKCCK